MLNKDICVIIPTWKQHLLVFEKCVLSCRKIDPLLVVVSYDNHFKDCFPINLMSLADHFLFSDRKGKGTHWIIQQKDALSYVSRHGIKVVISLNGDCVIGNPDRFMKSIEDFKHSKYDIFSYFHGMHKKTERIGTMAFMAKFNSLTKIIKRMEEDSLYRSRENNESKMVRIIHEFGMKISPVDNSENIRCPSENSGTWVKDFSFAHLHP